MSVETVVISPILFYLMSTVIIFGALGMTISKNLFRSAMCMLLSFLGVAGLYASMDEQFLAIAQILVYVGAITILLIFGLMLTNSHGTRTLTNPFSQAAVGGGIVAIGICILLSVTIRVFEFLPLPAINVPTTYTIGIGLFGIHILPTEIAAVLLLVAMIGSVMISRKGDDEE